MEETVRTSVSSVVLKLCHVEEPQIDTYQPTDPHLKRHARGPHIKEDLYKSSGFPFFLGIVLGILAFIGQYSRLTGKGERDGERHEAKVARPGNRTVDATQAL